MSRHARTEAPNKPDILHLLEYCRIDRAAELLGCEVCDLLHLEEVNHLSLYWNFKSELATLTWIELPSPKSVKCMGRVLIIGPHTRVGSLVANGFLDADKRDEDLPILLCGLWNAHGRHSYDLDTGPMMCVEISPDGVQMAAEMPEQWQKPSDDELYIMQADLMRLRKAITTGEPLESRDGLSNKQSEQMQQVRQQVNRRVRESIKPHRAIVEVLTATGFEPEDFRGSIPVLQAKLANKGFGGLLTSIDDKTLIDWLRRAGVR